MSSSFDAFCISAHVVRLDAKEPLYLLIRRCCAYLNGTWQMVTGGIEAGEKAWQAALREIHEETGLVPQRFYSADAVETFYMVDRDKIAIVPVFVAFVDNTEEVQLSPEEHDVYEWLPYEEAIEKLVWAEQRRILTQIHQNFVLKQPNPIHAISCEAVNKLGSGL